MKSDSIVQEFKGELTKQYQHYLQTLILGFNFGQFIFFLQIELEFFFFFF